MDFHTTQLSFLSDLFHQNLLTEKPRSNIPLVIKAYYSKHPSAQDRFDLDLEMRGQFDLSFTYSYRTTLFIFEKQGDRLYIPIKTNRINRSFDWGLDANENPYIKVIPSYGFQEVRLSHLKSAKSPLNLEGNLATTPKEQLSSEKLMHLGIGYCPHEPHT